MGGGGERRGTARRRGHSPPSRGSPRLRAPRRASARQPGLERKADEGPFGRPRLRFPIRVFNQATSQGGGGGGIISQAFRPRGRNSTRREPTSLRRPVDVVPSRPGSPQALLQMARLKGTAAAPPHKRGIGEEGGGGRGGARSLTDAIRPPLRHLSPPHKSTTAPGPGVLRAQENARGAAWEL